ncbi:hypothetical protein MYXO_02142 [Myxococcaceae bacterium]|jgi:hypothetical protein|nr:hypothetical protein MYXO_02142 [Myxococcaceae bacterium]
MPSPLDPCALFEDDLSAWIDAELPAERAGVVEEHVAGCARCRMRAESFRALDATLRGLPASRVPSDLEATLLARANAERPGLEPGSAGVSRLRPRRRSRLSIVVAVAAAAAAAFLVFVGFEREPTPLDPGEMSVVADLDTASDEDLSAALDLEALEDLEVIANLDLLERTLEPQDGRG